MSDRIIAANILLYGWSLRNICRYKPSEDDPDSSNK